MPKVAIDEYRHLMLREDNIGPTWQVLHVFSEPDSSFLKKRTQSPLEICIPVPDAGHAVAALLLREVVGHLRWKAAAGVALLSAQQVAG